MQKNIPQIFVDLKFQKFQELEEYKKYSSECIGCYAQNSVWQYYSVFLFLKHINISSVDMGACVSTKKQIVQPPVRKQRTKTRIIENDKELRLLQLLYSDLSSRSADGELGMQNFLLFFHKNGYWGERLFKQFDTGNSNTVTEDQFIRGIVKIFKTNEEKKIELLFKFFSENKIHQGISFNNFLRMLYNYPKEDFNKILNDSDFINKELKGCLIAADNQLSGRRLVSLSPYDMQNKVIHGKAFLLQQSQSNSERVQSKYGAKIINELNKKNNQRRTTLKIKVGQNDVQIKTTSVHQLVKKFARSIFKNYDIDEKTGRLSFENFRDWVTHHKNLYNDYYKGFHSEVWQVDNTTNNPYFVNLDMQFSSKARVFLQDRILKVVISLIHSILIVCEEQDNTNPINLICLQGLAANPVFDDSKGHGIQLTHRDGIYKTKRFYVINQDVQKQWMEFLKYYKGSSINQLYDIQDQIGTGKFSVVYACVEKATNQKYAIKVIESYKLDDQARVIIAHESSIMSVMSHPLLVFFKQSITTKTHIYIITQLVKGKDLFDFVREIKYLGESQASYILEQVIIGVRYIHSLGIVHRDLKPENIMLQYDEKKNTVGRIKIIDFGFANYLSNLRQMSREQLWAGTPNYIAPELLRQQPFSQKIDNFAIGSIMYFMLSGNLPFNSVDVSIILQKTMDGAFALNDKKWKVISDEAKDLVSKFLQNDPQDRISLDDALRHPWFEKNRIGRQAGTSMMLGKPIQLKNGGKQSTPMGSSGALIY